jgi:hypothetical protein
MVPSCNEDLCLSECARAHESGEATVVTAWFISVRVLTVDSANITLRWKKLEEDCDCPLH